MILSLERKVVFGKRSFPQARGAVVLSRNLAGMPFPSSVFFAPIWREETKARLQGVERIRPRKRGGSGRDSLLLSLLGIVSGEVLFGRKAQTTWQGVMVNGQDHVQIVAEGPTFRLSSLWKTVDFWDDEIERKVDYAYDPRWGYLTSSPSLLGTGCKVYLWVHLPALSFIYGEQRLLQWLRESGDLVVKGWGRNGEVCAHVFEISNRFTLGVSERDVVKMVETLGVRVLKWERQARLHFGDSPSRVDNFCESLPDIVQGMLKKDDNIEKGIFDFLSFWLLGEEEGIIGEDEGLRYVEVENLISTWLSGDTVRRERVEALKTLGAWPRRIFNHV